MGNYRIGLDIGIASVGWAVLDLLDNGDPYRIRARGACVSGGRTSQGREIVGGRSTREKKFAQTVQTETIAQRNGAQTADAGNEDRC